MIAVSERQRQDCKKDRVAKMSNAIFLALDTQAQKYFVFFQQFAFKQIQKIKMSIHTDSLNVIYL